MHNLPAVLCNFLFCDIVGYCGYQWCFTSVWSPVQTTTLAHTSSSWEDTLNMSAEEVSANVMEKKWMSGVYRDGTFCVCVMWRTVDILPGSLQSLRLRLKDLARDILIGCFSDVPRREDRPDGWEVEEVGPQVLRWSWLPVFKWSFSAFRFSTVD